LLELHPITEHRPNLRGQISAHCNGMLPQLAAGEGQHFLNRVVDVERHQLWSGLFG
jgi:hypothetical protein